MKNVNKILIVQTAFLGDIILTIPLINAVRTLHPKAYITVLTTPIGKEVIEGQDSISEILVYDKKGTQKGLKAFLKIIQELRRKKIDWAIVPHRSLRSALLVYFSGISERWGFNNSEGKWFFTKRIEYKYDIHEIDRNLELLKEFNRNFNTNINLYLDGNIKSNIDKEFDKIRRNDSLCIGIHPGSAWATKRWPLEKYLELIDRLLSKDCKIFVFGDENDTFIDEAVKSKFNNVNSNIYNLIGKTSIKELIVYIKNLSIYITNDSGPMHIAASLDIPTIAIFGPTTKRLGFFPYSEKAVVIEKQLSCRPCSRHGGKKCPKKHFKCMNNITVSEVYEAATIR